MPDVIEPMKARLDSPGAGVEWNFEVKWDGYRAIAFCDRDGLRLQGRKLNRIDGDFPELGQLGRDRDARGLVLDGELVVLDDDGRPSFQLMQARRERRLQAHFMIFDLLWARGRDLRGESYAHRREELERVDLDGPTWSAPDRLDGTLEEVLEVTSALGLEGILAKDPDSRYVEGRRTGYWLKVKHTRQQEFVIGGWTPGKGHRSGTLGSLLVGFHDDEGAFRYAGRVGTGMDDQLLRRLAADLAADSRADSPFEPGDRDAIPRDALWCEPRIVIEARFTQWTSDGRLRNPVFVGFRPDKEPAEVVREELA